MGKWERLIEGQMGDAKMTKRPAKPSAGQKQRSSAADDRHPDLQSVGTKSAPATGSPGIRDAVRDRYGAPWIRYGTETRSVWFAAADLIGAGTEVFKQLATVGPPLLTDASKNDLKRRIEACAITREALVASRPGWLGECPIFVFGDGTVLRPKGDAREIIIAFEPNPKFSPRGSLDEWQAEVAPFVRYQPLPYFAVAYALVGPLLHFLQRGQLNPVVEVVGGKELGKSTVGVLAASVWAGVPNSQIGGGESWDLTINAIDDLKLLYRGGCLFLDEGNLVGVPAGKLPEFLEDAIFKLSSDRGKRRWGDPGASETANVATLSTTNTPLRDLAGSNDARREALKSRLITLTLPLDHSHGVFHSLPDGYGSSKEAAEALQKAADVCWGAPSRHFVGKLVRRVDRDETRLRRHIAKRVARYIKKLPILSGSARVQKTFALVAVAASLARDWGVIPKAWGSPTAMVGAVARLAGDVHTEAPLVAIERIRAYVMRENDKLVDVADLKKPLPEQDFKISAGFRRVRKGRTELLVPAEIFQTQFPDHKALINALLRDGWAQIEDGTQKKHSIKAPRAICARGRVYCITLN